ncbi:MAG: RNA methyltransferase [Rhizobiaceae bacterium]|nr:RNA methyltransferase [Rhizobiaceae bacterium]
MSSSVIRPGRIEEISSPSNPRIKSIKALSMKKNRDREGVFLAEGQKLVTDALEKGWTVRTLLHSRRLLEDDRQSDKIRSLAATVRARGGDVLITNDKLLTSITRRDNPQAVIGVVEQKLSDVSQVTQSEDDCWLALDRVRDPGNLGTIIRTADALGARGVMLVGETTDPFALEAVRATMGSLFHVDLVRLTEAQFGDFTVEFRQQGGVVIGTHLRGAVDHRSIDYSSGPKVLLMGNEQQGLTDELAAVCDHVVLISMNGAADSLNLAVATGIMLFEARRHKLPAIGAV